MANYNVPPYFDTTEEEYQKNYKRILANPGRNLQAREVSVLQGLTLKHLENFGKSFFVDGHIIEGCDILINGTTVTITAGKIYASGLIHNIPESQVTITGNGTEIIGLKVTEQIITANDDITLRDPAQGYVNYSQPGADRVKVNLEFVVNDDTAIPIYTLVNGAVQTAPPKESEIYKILAERTYDESGNYRVYGLTSEFNQEIDEDTIEIKVSPGKCYVLGWKIIQPANQFVRLDKSKDTRQTLNEPHVYYTGTDTYKLIHQPIKDIVTVTATVQVGNGGSTGNSITKGVPDGSDPLGYDSVTEILDVWDSTHGSYIQGTDYVLTNNSVDWSPAGNEPSQGATYYVTFRYLKNMEQGTDYQLTTIDDEQYVDFSVGGDNPVDGTTFLVDYDWYLARYDVLHIDREGNLNIIKGTPDTIENVRVPNTFINTLPLAVIYLPPNSADIGIQEISNYRLTMDDLHTLYERLIDDEFNIAQLDLEKTTLKKESSIYLRGIFTDNFLTINKADIGNVDFSACIDLRIQQLTLASLQQTTALSPDLVNSTMTIKSNSAFVPYTESTALQQSYATDSINVNPYGAFTRQAIIKLSPPTYTWMDTEYHDVITQTTYGVKRAWTFRHHGNRPFSTYGETGFGHFGTWNFRWGWWDELENTYNYQYRPYRQHSGATATREVSKQLMSIRYAGQRLATYVPQITVTVTGEDFEPDADNLRLYVNGQPVSLTPIDGTPSGTTSGTVKAKSDGTLKATFVMPSGVPTGTVNIELKNASIQAKTTMETAGIVKVYNQEYRREINMVEHWVRHFYDPIAQTFAFDKDTFITKAGIYFKTKSATEPVLVQIREVVNGVPGANVLGEKILLPADINTSDDASLETQVEFPLPIYIKANTQYALTLHSESNDYSVWIAKGGETDVSTNEFVATQPYTTGVLLVSSNNAAWSAKQDSDLKFNLYKAIFTTGTEYEFRFSEVTGLNNFSRFIAESASLVFENTNLNWEYSIDSGTTWTLFEIGDQLETDMETLSDKLLIRARAITNNPNISPVINFGGATLTTFLYESANTYLTLNTDTSQAPYSQIKITYEALLPNGTTATPYFSDDTGNTWKPLSLVNSYELGNSVWKYEYQADLLASPPTVTSDNATISDTGGNLADNTYYYIFTGTNSEGETTGCAEFSVTVATGTGTSQITFDLSNAFDSHTTGFKVYRATASGAETLKYIVSGTPDTWTDNGIDSDASSDVPPTNNTARYSTNNFKGKIELSTNNQVYTPRIKNYVAIFKETI